MPPDLNHHKRISKLNFTHSYRREKLVENYLRFFLVVKTIQSHEKSPGIFKRH
jgi:hypothetical protein